MLAIISYKLSSAECCFLLVYFFFSLCLCVSRLLSVSVSVPVSVSVSVTLSLTLPLSLFRSVSRQDDFLSSHWYDAVPPLQADCCYHF